MAEVAQEFIDELDAAMVEEMAGEVAKLGRGALRQRWTSGRLTVMYPSTHRREHCWKLGSRARSSRTHL